MSIYLVVVCLAGFIGAKAQPDFGSKESSNFFKIPGETKNRVLDAKNVHLAI